jgi:hypothetical protein
MDTGKLITLGAVGVGLWLLYEWLLSQCESPSSPLFASSPCALILGTPAGLTIPTTGTAPVTTTPPVTTAPVTAAPPTSTTTASSLAAVLTQAATAGGNDPSSLSPDQWSYIYQQIPGKPQISPALFESILASLGLTDATRSTIVTAQAFASALVSNGLSGLGHSPFSASWVPGGMIHGGLFG